MAARAAELGDVGDSAPEHWESPLGTPDVHVALAVLSPDAERLEALRRARPPCAGAAAGRRADLAAGLLPAADRADVVRLQGWDRPAGDRGQRHPADESDGAADQAGRVHSRLPGRDGIVAADADARPCWDRTAPTSSFASSTPASPRTAGTSARRPPRVRRRRCSARRWSGAGKAARRSRSPPTKTIPSSARTTRGTTRSSTAMIRAGSNARPVRTHAGRTRETHFDGEGSVDVRLHRMIRRGTSYGPMLPEGVLEDDGQDRGIIFVFAGVAPEAPVRVRQDPVAERRDLHRRPAGGRSAGRPSHRLERVHDPEAADQAPASGRSAVRRHARRRILLRTRPARPALARRARHLGDAVASSITHTDRWKALDFGPPLGKRGRTR